jgi:tripartite-type tricarboxylate transporter receptor subunit TctC
MKAWFLQAVPHTTACRNAPCPTLNLAGGAASLALPAFAAWPDKPIKIVVTFPAGGASDIVARVMAEQLATKLGQAVVVDNRPGAGGSVGGLVVTQAPADGYTLMLSNSTPVSIGPFALEKQPYDPVEGFTHIALIGNAPCVVMANPKPAIKTMADLEAGKKPAGSTSARAARRPSATSTAS